LLLGSGSVLAGGETLRNTLASLFSEKPILALLYFGGIGFLLLSIGFALWALKVRKWQSVPNVKTLLSEYKDAPHTDILIRNVSSMIDAVTDSEKKNDSKANLIQVAWSFLIAGLIMVFLAIINQHCPGLGKECILWKIIHIHESLGLLPYRLFDNAQ
jgi:Flp pilus assembly protein TadB